MNTIPRHVGSQGFSLIELVAFIVIIGLVAKTILFGINQALLTVNKPQDMAQAAFLANARMNIILANRDTVGVVVSLSDPCAGGSPPAVCTPLSTYASANSLTVNTTVAVTLPTALITVSITGASNATLQAKVSNYEQN